MKLNERNLVYYATCKSPADKSGFLFKKGERNTAYHKRWFVLKGNMLFYFDNEESKEPVGVIILEGCRVELCEATEEFAFAIKFACTKSRAYVLATDSQRAMESWVKALSRANFEYIRLVVNELQKQLEEVQEKSPAYYKVQAASDNGSESNSGFHNPGHLLSPNPMDTSVPLSNGCAVWDHKPSHLAAGYMQDNGLKAHGVMGHPGNDFGVNARPPPLPPRRRPQAGTALAEPCPSAEDCPVSHGGICFSTLHEWYGEEMVGLRTKWRERIQTQL
ncbi:sesquipedalian-1 [Ascaphus truei]|uniref:sesquipedalian-1 n=1 Tax=Ascaphus truei TaxID=8439 RepID=UPI003F59797C